MLIIISIAYESLLCPERILALLKLACHFEKVIYAFERNA